MSCPLTEPLIWVFRYPVLIAVDDINCLFERAVNFFDPDFTVHLILLILFCCWEFCFCCAFQSVIAHIIRAFDRPWSLRTSWCSRVICVTIRTPHWLVLAWISTTTTNYYYLLLLLVVPTNQKRLTGQWSAQWVTHDRKRRTGSMPLTSHTAATSKYRRICCDCDSFLFILSVSVVDG
jgi:hypothetical protein